jgi:hypothetical protein
MSKHDITRFDPKAVAHLDAQMWQAYYAHKFIKLFFVLLKMFRVQFGVSRFTALRLAYFSGRAAKIFRKSEDKSAILKYLIKYYSLMDKHALQDINARECAETELYWWLVHRYPKKYDKSLALAVSEAMAAYYAVTPESLTLYGKHRADAMKIRDTATHIDKIEPDWQKIDDLLVSSYASLYDAVNR